MTVEPATNRQLQGYIRAARWVGSFRGMSVASRGEAARLAIGVQWPLLAGAVTPALTGGRPQRRHGQPGTLDAASAGELLRARFRGPVFEEKIKILR